MVKCTKCGERREKYKKCKPCRRARRKPNPLTPEQKKVKYLQESLWREKNREYDLAKKKAHRRANIETVLVHDRERHAANAEERNGKRRIVYAANPGHAKAINKKSIAKHREKVRVRDKERAKTPAARASRKRHWEANQAKYRAANKVWRENNKARAAATNRKWVLETPESAAALKRSYKARKMGAFGSHTAEDWSAIKAAQDARCTRCPLDAPLQELHADHMVPLRHGGADYAWNIQGLCLSHNSAKNAKFIGPINEYDRGPDGTLPISAEHWHQDARNWNLRKKAQKWTPDAPGP